MGATVIHGSTGILDTQFSYHAERQTGLPTKINTRDRPVNGSAQVWRSDHFTMYLLYQVNTAGSMPVPLKKLDWSWSGVAQTNGAGGWQLLSASVALQNVNVSAGYPVWTNNTITGTTVTSNQWINPFP
jgi:hypothetical protein